MGHARTSSEHHEFSALEQQFQRMLEDRFLDGLIRRFEKLFPAYSPHVEDVVLEEIVKLAEATSPAPTNLRAVLTWRLRKRMLDVAKRPSVVEAPEQVDNETPERLAIRKEMFSQVKSLLDGWENRSMALVVHLTLAAVYYDEVLEVEEIRELVYEQLGHELTTANVWKLRSRGLKRLTTEVAGLLGEYAENWQVNENDLDEGPRDARPASNDNAGNGKEE